MIASRPIAIVSGRGEPAHQTAAASTGKHAPDQACGLAAILAVNLG
jgi:hypothetical protein